MCSDGLLVVRFFAQNPKSKAKELMVVRKIEQKTQNHKLGLQYYPFLAYNSLESKSFRVAKHAPVFFPFWKGIGAFLFYNYSMRSDLLEFCG